MIELIFDVSGTTRYGATVHHADAFTTDWLKQLGAWAHGTDYYLHLRIEDNEEDIQAYVDAHITPQLRAHMHSASLYLNPYTRGERHFCFVYFDNMLSTEEWDALCEERRLAVALLAHQNGHTLAHHNDVVSLIAGFL